MDICRKKQYTDNYGYHIFNRGVAKDKIFYSHADRNTYVRFLREYLIPTEILIDELNGDQDLPKNLKFRKISNISKLKNFSTAIQVSSFCLMTNHVHLVVHQNHARDIAFFMKSLHTRYAQFINRKYARVGHLFQDRFNAIPIHDREYLVWLSRYIHRNPAHIMEDISRYSWSSFQYFGSKKKPDWLSTELVTSAFLKSKYSKRYPSYREFVFDDSL